MRGGADSIQNQFTKYFSVTPTTVAPITINTETQLLHIIKIIEGTLEAPYEYTDYINPLVQQINSSIYPLKRSELINKKLQTITELGIVTLFIDSTGTFYLVNDNTFDIAQNDFYDTLVSAAFALKNKYGGTYTGINPLTPILIKNPSKIAMNSSGTFIIADTLYHYVYMFKNGVISMVAGTGVPGFSGDSGPANEAQLNNPKGVAIDNIGNIYISDSNNHRIRKVSIDGKITTIAGTGTGDFVDGDIHTALLHFPSGIALDSSGNIFIADSNNHRIRKIASSNGYISTVAGVGSAGFKDDTVANAQFRYPQGVSVNKGNLYIADSGNSCIRKSNGANVTTIAGSLTSGSSGDDGPANAAQLNYPTAVTIDNKGNIYITDTNNSSIRKITNNIISSINNTDFDSPTDIIIDSTENLYIVDFGNQRVCSMQNGVVSSIIPIPISEPSPAPLGETTALVPSPNPSPNPSPFPNPVPAPTQALVPFVLPSIIYPTSLVFDNLGNMIFVDHDNQYVYILKNGILSILAGTGVAGYNGDNILAKSAQLNNPSGVALDTNTGDIYISDTNNHRIRKITKETGFISTVAGSGVAGFSDDDDGDAATSAKLNHPIGIVYKDDTIYFTDTHNNRVRKIYDDTISTVAGNGSESILNYPTGIAIDSDNNLYIVDTNNHCIQKYTTSLSVLAGSGAAGYTNDIDKIKFNYPTGIAVDANGTIYISDSGNQCIRKITVDTSSIISTISTIGGNNTAGFLGDGGVAVSGQLNWPQGIYLDRYHNVFFTDYDNNSIRVIKTNGYIYSIYPIPTPINPAGLTSSQRIAIDSNNNNIIIKL